MYTFVIMAKKVKTAKQMERHFKGTANHRRIEILIVVAKNRDISLEEITEILQCNIKTVSEHTRRLVQAGLLDKRYEGRKVLHALSPYGEIFHAFIRTFQHS